MNFDHYYMMLCCSPNSSLHQIKESYKKLLLKNHPDKVCSERRLEAEEYTKLLNEAYDHLVNNHTKKTSYQIFYEQKDIIVKLSITLNQIFNEDIIEIEVPRQFTCQKCKGIGVSHKEHMLRCPVCYGKGFTNFVFNCASCRGTGRIMDPLHICSMCDGNRYVLQNNDIEVHLYRTMRNNDVILFEGYGSCMNDITGNIKIIIQIQEHCEFKVEGDNLKTFKNLTLAEALCGFRFAIHHVDSNILIIEQNTITHPNDKLCIQNQGLFKSDHCRGNLIIQLNIIFPDHIEKSKELQELLGVPDKYIGEGILCKPDILRNDNIKKSCCIQ